MKTLLATRPSFGSSRLAGLPRWPARIALLLLLPIGFLLALNGPGAPRVTGKAGHSDVALYRAIDQRILRGENYYTAAASEQRARGYPLKPFVTMRLPTLAWVCRITGGLDGAQTLMRLLALITAGATAWRLQRAGLPRPLWIASALLAALATGVIAQPSQLVWHEAWAGLLLGLSLACRSPRNWWPSVLLGLAAVLVRELAMPYLVAMLAMAILERRRAEAAAWGVAIVAVGVALALHAHAVASVSLAGDASSPGWSSFGGWRFDATLMRDTSIFSLLPNPVGTLLAAVALLGWASYRSDYTTRYALTLALWLGAFLVIGRPDNFYWGLMLAPLLPIGLPLALPALRDLVRAAAQ